MKALTLMRTLIAFNCFVTASVRATVPPVVTTEYFTDFRNPVYVNIGAVDQFPFTVSGVTFVTDPAHVAGQFVGFPAMGGSADPGDGTGYLSANAGSPTPIPFITITFSQPLAAFGVTFYHHIFDLHMELPSTLSVFDGPNGSGNLLGQVTSVRANDDFVGIWSGARNIQSAILRGTRILSERSKGTGRRDGEAVELDFLAEFFLSPVTAACWRIGAGCGGPL